MSDSKPALGSISWRDLTVGNAEEVSRFYQAVVGWTAEPLDMGGYSDFCMNVPGTAETVAGICHARGENADLPPQWLIYITVGDLQKSLEQCKSLGGKVIAGPRETSQGKLAVIKDPAGAVAALFQSSALG